jgi:hypothetical protein
MKLDFRNGVQDILVHLVIQAMFPVSPHETN